MSLNIYQQLMEKVYGSRDRKRGVERTLLWFISEAGEVADALVKNDREALKTELADALAWLLSFCNLVNVNLEDAFLERYGNGCPNCRKKPCECIFI